MGFRFYLEIVNGATKSFKLTNGIGSISITLFTTRGNGPPVPVAISHITFLDSKNKFLTYSIDNNSRAVNLIVYGRSGGGRLRPDNLNSGTKFPKFV